MPHYHFELHVTLAKFGEQPIHMQKQVMDLYITVIVEIAYSMAKSYIEQGWRIDKIELRNFVFMSDINLTWND